MTKCLLPKNASEIKTFFFLQIIEAQFHKIKIFVCVVRLSAIRVGTLQAYRYCATKSANFINLLLFNRCTTLCWVVEKSQHHFREHDYVAEWRDGRPWFAEQPVDEANGHRAQGAPRSLIVRPPAEPKRPERPQSQSVS